MERSFRPDVEGLRAVAVVAVVLYHARLAGVDGGFVGVDVFFVVSGYLITRLLIGELAETGSISLAGFWARRARRLLPASTCAVVVTVVLAQRMLPPLSLRSLGADAIAAATFSSNVVFAGRLGDYFGAQLGASAPSPLLHFWSLAVEEQFYLCWPPLLVLLTRRPRHYRRLLLAVTGVLGCASLALAIVLTATAPTWAFYLLPARMGELLAGALLAALGASTRVPTSWRGPLGWLGLGGIAAACVGFDESVAWPGVAVLVPVAATMAVIMAGPAGPAGSARSARSARTAGSLLAAAPLQWLGRHSYALYLWHWPALVLAEARWGPLAWGERLAAVATAVGMSALSVRLVEDPVRHSRSLGRSPRRSLAVGAVMSLCMVVVGWDVRASVGPLDGGVEADAPQLALGFGALAPEPRASATTPAASSAPAPPETSPASIVPPDTPPPSSAPEMLVPDPPSGRLAELVGATQRALAAATAPVPVPSNLRPSLAGARQRSRPYEDGCVNIGSNHRLQPCEYGVPGASTTIVLFGDSHAAQWFEPLEQIAVQRGLRLVVLLKAGCPVAEVEVPTPVLRYTCPPYRDRALEWIERNDPALVVAGNSYTQYPADAAAWSAGTDAAVARLAAAARRVVLLGDNPMSVEDPPACLSANLDDVTACATAREDAVLPQRISAEVGAARAHRVTFVDTTAWFCTAEVCPAVLGDILVMRDETHITVPMAEFLQPLLAAAIAPHLDNG